MRKMIVTATVGLLLCLGMQAYGNSFFQFTANGDSGMTADGWVNACNGTATAGWMTVNLNGESTTYQLENLGPIQLGTYVTSQFGHFYADNWISCDDPSIVTWYALVFQRSGTELNLCSNFDPGAGIVPTSGGPWFVLDGVTYDGNLTVACPDGGLTAMLLGMGMLGMGWMRRLVKK